MIPKRWAFIIVFFAIIALTVPGKTSASPLIARVHVVDGVPRLLINGVRTTPRIFWGGPGSPNIPIKAGEQSISFEFQPIADEPHIATLHFRFQHIPSNLLLQRVHLVDLTTGNDVIPDTNFGDQAQFDRDWAYWPANAPGLTGAVNVLPLYGPAATGGVLLSQHLPVPGQTWSDTHIHHNTNLALFATHTYRLDITLWSDVPTFGNFCFYRPSSTGPYVLLASARDTFTDQIKLAANAGVNIISFGCELPWPKPTDTRDASDIDTICQTILKANSNALILPRIYIRAPDWWLDSHPDDEMRWKGTQTHPRTAAVSSELFRIDASVQLKALIQHLESKFGEHMIGYHVAGQNSDEWFYMDAWGPDWNGYANSDTSAFRTWLTAKYRTDAALQAA